MILQLPIFRIQEGDIINQDIYSLKTRQLIISKGTPLTNPIIKRLEELEINQLFVEREIKDQKYAEVLEKYQEAVTKFKDIFVKTTLLNKLDASQIQYLTDLLLISKDSEEEIIKCLLSVRNVDKCTYIHSINTAFYCMLIGIWLELSIEEIRSLTIAGLVHDIGKTKIPLSILQKPGRLTVEEYAVIKNHPALGYDIVKNLKEFNDDIKRAVLLHHERADAEGYPLNVSISKFGLYPSIVAIADVYDAITSDRPYKEASLPFDALEIIIKSPGQFNYSVQTTFIQHMITFLLGARVLLNDNREGKVSYIPPDSPWLPIIETECEGFINLRENQNLRIIDILEYTA